MRQRVAIFRSVLPMTLAAAVGLLFIKSLGATAPPVATADTTLVWTARANMPTARDSLGLAAGSNGKLYAIGGEPGPTATNEAYDPVFDTWASAASNGKLYAIGGLAVNVGLTATVEEYDPTSDAWASRKSMPTARQELGLASSLNGKLYAIGGTGGQQGNEMEEYDPTTDTWATRSPMPTARHALAAETAANGKIYAVGGQNGNNTPLSTVEQATISFARIALPAVMVSTSNPSPIVQNGGFENGLTGWQTSQPAALPVSLVTDPALAHSGSGAALLGSPTYNSNCSNGGIPTSPAYVAQQVTVPNTPKPTLTFWYHIFTQDWTGPDPHHPIYDSFGIYVTTIDDAHGLFHDGNPSVSNAPGCTKPILDLGWKEGTVDLSGYQGQTVTLYFANVNGTNPIWNTYTYLDDIAITAN